jgi:hypothetical protein
MCCELQNAKPLLYRRRKMERKRHQKGALLCTFCVRLLDVGTACAIRSTKKSSLWFSCGVRRRPLPPRLIMPSSKSTKKQLLLLYPYFSLKLGGAFCVKSSQPVERNSIIHVWWCMRERERWKLLLRWVSRVRYKDTLMLAIVRSARKTRYYFSRARQRSRHTALDTHLNKRTPPKHKGGWALLSLMLANEFHFLSARNRKIIKCMFCYSYHDMSINCSNSYVSQNEANATKRMRSGKR